MAVRPGPCSKMVPIPMSKPRSAAGPRPFALPLSRRLRSLAVAAAAASAVSVLAGVALPGRASAMTQSYCSFPASLATWTYNGNAFEAQNSLIRLTTTTSNEAASAFLTTPIALGATTSLHAHFRFQMGPSAAGGDGIAFVMQNSAAAATALGGTANNLGYSGITPSVAIKFDTYDNGATDHGANYVAIELNGSTALAATGYWATPAFTMAGGGVLHGWVDYAPGTLSVYLSQSATKPATPLITHALTLTTQIGALMYVGFSAATGTNTQIDQQDVLEFALSTDGVPCSCEGDSACTGATPACGAAGICAVCSATNATACTGATPVCNAPTNTCVGCLTAASCAAPKPICDSTSRSCRACSGNADCGGTSPQCATVGPDAGSCVTCVADANCPPATPRCSTVTNTCAQCLSGADCGGNTPVCSAGKCRACASDADCGGSTPACEVWGACGQCSSTNASACTSGTAVCDDPSGTCVGCRFDADCGGAKPVCNTSTHSCAPCASNADCASSAAGPACALTGRKEGACVGCAADADCKAAGAPKCDLVADQCVACLTKADCSGATPVCGAAHACVACLAHADCPATAPVCDFASSTCTACQNDYAASTPGPHACSTAAAPACQPPGSPLAGRCGACSSLNNAACASLAATPVCIPASAVCGCAKDPDCNAGSYCDTGASSTGACKPGCRVVAGVDNCATGEFCSKTDGSVGACTTEPCNGRSDCSAPTPICDTTTQPHACAQCVSSSDCEGGKVCDATRHCVECTAAQTASCDAAGKGAACLATETCGCLKDADCGGAASGRVCDAATSACTTGCRGSDGNACPAGQQCSSSTSSIGTCAPTSSDAGSDAGSPDASSPDASGGDTGADAGEDASASGADAGGASSGCGCHVVPADTSTGLGVSGALVGLIAFVRRRARGRVRAVARRER